MPFAGYDDFDSCVSSNSDKDDPEAYCAAIKRKVEGAELSEAEQQALQESDCPDGEVSINGECIAIEEVENVPPSALDMSDAQTQILQLADLDTEPIERIEQSDGTVRYTNLKLLSPGMWTDAASREQIWYSPSGIKNLQVREDNTLNVMHDVDNDVSDIGLIDPESVEASDSGLYADVVLHMNNAASEFADENLQKALKSGGTKGFGGPSVEIDAEGQEIEYNSSKDAHELKAGYISGAGLVKNPASKPVEFARQTATRQVALSAGTDSNGNNAKALHLSQRDMADVDSVRDALDAAGMDTSDMSDDEVMQVAESVMGAMDGEEMGDYEDDEEEEEDTEMADDEESDEEEGDEEDMEMQGEAVDVLQEQIDDLWGEIEEMKEAMMGESELSEELEDAKADLADAETAQELSEAVEEIDKRLSEIENQPESPKTLAEGNSESDEWDIWSEASGIPTESPNTL